MMQKKKDEMWKMFRQTCLVLSALILVTFTTVILFFSPGIDFGVNP